jgi:predicted ATPase
VLHQFEFSNFQSFLEPAQVDFRINNKVQMTDLMFQSETGQPLTKLMAVIGPNGSGKTALLKVPAFLFWFMSQSFVLSPEADIPVAPHFATSNSPSKFSCIFEFDKKVWRYELECTSKRVIREALFQKGERFSYVFTRIWDSKSERYVVKQKDFGFASQEAKKVRDNASLISTAAQYNVPTAVALQKMINGSVVYNVFFGGRVPHDGNALQTAAAFYASRDDIGQKMTKLLASWDLGLTGVQVQKVQRKLDEQEITTWSPHGTHRLGKREIVLPFHFESSGTQTAFILLSHLLRVLSSGGLAIIDEFESDLHPHMLKPILDLFANSVTNPHNAQLIFSSHAIQVLNLLNKAQVTLVTKDENLNSWSARLDDIDGIRNDDNFYSKYMAGAYGAVPEI